MALQKCRECGEQVSSQAKACPSCGAKPKKRIGLGGIVLVAFLGYVAFQMASPKPSNHPGIPEGAAVASSPAPKPVSPEVQKEIARLSALAPQDFCSRELRKFRSTKGPLPPVWLEAAEAVMKKNGVSNPHLAALKTGSVEVGMTPCGAWASWGLPESVNTTTTANTVSEQWVYGGRNYLYFRNGRLTTIQN